MKFIAANNAASALSGPITNVATTIQLQVGTGALFPDPDVGTQYFVGTLTDALTETDHEIVWVTKRIGDTLTVLRAREGTTARSWIAGDLFDNMVTAGQIEACVQDVDAQSQSFNFGVDSGSVNALVIALDPVISVAPPDGTPIRTKVKATNNGPTTCDAGWGAVGVVRRDNSDCIGNELIADMYVEFLWKEAAGKLQIQGGQPATAAAITAGTDTQSFVTPAQLAAATKPGSGQVYCEYVSTTSIKLIPFNGNAITVAGQQIAIASGGVSAANTNVTVNGTPAQNLAASTVYLVAIGATGVLEFWTLATGHNSDTAAGNIGIEVITGHATKTLVGMIATDGSSHFSAALTLSWFNRQFKPQSSTFSGDQTVNTTTVPIPEVDTSIRNTFLVWAGQNISYSVTGTGVVGGSNLAVGILFDGGGPEQAGSLFINQTAGGGGTIGFNAAFTGTKSGLSEGKHYATLAANTGGAAGLMYGGTAVPSAQAPPGPGFLLTVNPVG